MIQITVNDKAYAEDVTSSKELRDRLTQMVPAGEAIASLRVNGHELAETKLDEFDAASVRTLEVRTQPLGEMARSAVGETADWIRRITGVLESVASDFRRGEGRDGSERLVDALDALQVLVHLLSSIHSNLDAQARSAWSFDERWTTAEGELRSSVEGLLNDLESGDWVRIADCTGHALPRCLGSFRALLEQIPA